jgi:predicted transcriptional regulator
MASVSRRKATVYVEEELLRGAKILAARTDRRDSEVLEDALRKYLGVEVLERIWERGGLSEDEALEIAYRELDAARKQAGRRPPPGAKA